MVNNKTSINTHTTGLNDHYPSKPLGFTIVELLVAIVVIGVLAAITIVSYTGIQSRARVATIQSDLTNASRLISLDQVVDGIYPNTIAEVNDNKGIPASRDTVYQYVVNNDTYPQTFCIAATIGTTSYKINNGSAPSPGSCSVFGFSNINPAKSCYSIKLNGVAFDGVYWVDPDGSGAGTPFRVYCDMTYDGGGWTMLMKATRGTTFNYNASYWTTNNTLNETDLSRNDGDAKYRSFNELATTDIMARWPDANDIRWLHNVAWTARTALIGFNEYRNWGNHTASPYWNATYFSSQVIQAAAPGPSAWGTKLGDLGGSASGARWGYRFNENGPGDWGSDDVGSGVGNNTAGRNYSAGDWYNCCGSIGINRSARVEVYGRNTNDLADSN